MKAYTGAEHTVVFLISIGYYSKYHKQPPQRQTANEWYNFSESGCVAHRIPGHGRPTVSEVTIHQVQQCKSSSSNSFVVQVNQQNLYLEF